MTTFFEEADTAAIFADALTRGLGVAVVIGSSNLVGIVDYVGKDVLASMGVASVSGRTITVSIQTSTLPSPLPNRSTTLTVDGVSYRLRDSLQQGDGALTHLLCEAVS